MSMLNCKKTGILLMAIMIGVVWIPSMALAAEMNQRPPAPTEGTPVEYGSAPNVYSVGTMSFQYLSSWNASIVINSGNSIQVQGYTETFEAVDKVAVKLYLQYWDSASEQWIDSIYAGEWFNTNSSSVTAYKNYNVASQYYYRTRTVNYAVESGVTESQSNVSNYIYIP